MRMPKTLFNLCLSGCLLFSCGKSPESAAQEVCNCMTKLAGSDGLSAMAGNAAECSQLQQKYASQFQGDDLNTYTRQVTQCAMDRVSQ